MRGAASSPAALCRRISSARFVSLPTSRTVVMPQASQMLSSYSSGCGLPPRSSCRWPCALINPGRTYLPVASITASATASACAPWRNPRAADTASSGMTSAIRLSSMTMSLGPLAGVPLPSITMALWISRRCTRWPLAGACAMTEQPSESTARETIGVRHMGTIVSRPQHGSNMLKSGMVASGSSSGRVAQLVRAPRLHRGGPGFESLRAHHFSPAPAGPDTTVKPNDPVALSLARRLIAGSALIVLVYLGLGLTNVFTPAPWCDEAWFGNPAYNLAYKGFMGTTILDPASSTWKSVKLTGIDRHTYWVMPLNLLWNAAGFRAFGFSVFSMRLVSLVWGLLALGAWGAILWKLTGQPMLTLGSLGLIAVDYHFLLQASDGRMDVMTVALGWSGVAVYLLLRERSFPRAVLVSQSLTAMACFTHPNGLLFALILLATTLYFDHRRIRIGTVAIAAVPYLVGAAGWALYITDRKTVA